MGGGLSSRGTPLLYSSEPPTFIAHNDKTKLIEEQALREGCFYIKNG